MSYGRFNVEAKCRIKSLEKGNFTDYFLLTKVMAGNVYAEDDLIKVPPYEYSAVFSNTEFKIFRNYELQKVITDNFGKNEEFFKTVNIHLGEIDAVPVNTFEDLKSVTLENKQVVILASLLFEEIGFVAELLFPANHINISSDSANFQIETGPVITPDLKSNKGDINCLDLAYLALNDFEKMFFVRFGNRRKYGRVLRFYNQVDRQKARIKLMTYQ